MQENYEITKNNYGTSSDTVSNNYSSTNVATETIDVTNTTGPLNKEDIDFTKISTSISGVLDGKTVSVNEKYWGDNGDLTYEIRKGDVVAIKENGQILGFTTLEGINKQPESVVVTPTEETIPAIEPTTQTSIPSPTAEDVYTQTEIEKPTEAEETKPVVEEEPEVVETPTPTPAVTPTPQFQYTGSGNTIKVGDYNNPYDNLVVSSAAGGAQTYINGQVAERRKVNYTDDDLYYMAQLVENEASSSGVTGQVAVAEEIRNRVLSSDPYYKNTVTGVLDQGYTPWASKDPRRITPKQETIDLCKGVLDGNIWVFGRDDVLSHASHSGKGIPDSQPGVKGSSSYAAFYYDGINRTQTFYTSGNLTEETRLV